MPWSAKAIRRFNLAAGVISTLALVVVASMRRIHFETSIDFSFLPAIHSSLNALCAGVLLMAIYQIKHGKVSAHKRLMTLALILSACFLVSYVVYHTTASEVRFCREGWIRPVYFTLLITHVVLAAAVFPMILFTYVRGLTLQVEAHRRLAKYTFPIWLYVCVSGPICYLLLRPCFVVNL
ncbi:MAG: DUF420 domain-containing protein [Saprospiraceae bacterium]|jgi:putative membrane protein|nr:DUF420 domain-containing protein [Saprospiraceae bacterium]MBP9209414.1 DUF420 domain-containing protein [Saprospiraceae bacterium]MBV6471856.1 hypothetical protein [Saprospiraceae bacterium]